MSTVTQGSQTANDFDPFKYFPGGKQGILERFCLSVKEYYKGQKDDQLKEICKHRGVDYSHLREILDKDNPRVNAYDLQSLMDTTRGINTIFGQVTIPPEEENKLINMANEDEFIEVVGEGDHFTTSNRLELYLITEALGRLA